MFSIIFQLAGSILLSWMVISRNKKDIISESWIVMDNGPKILRLFQEKYLSIFGFVYISIGYVIQLFSIDTSISKFLYYYNPINRFINFNIYIASIFNIAFLVSSGVLISYKVSKYSADKVTADEIDKNAPNSAIKMEAY